MKAFRSDLLIAALSILLICGTAFYAGWIVHAGPSDIVELTDADRKKLVQQQMTSSTVDEELRRVQDYIDQGRSREAAFLLANLASWEIVQRQRLNLGTLDAQKVRSEPSRLQVLALRQFTLAGIDEPYRQMLRQQYPIWTDAGTDDSTQEKDSFKD